MCRRCRVQRLRPHTKSATKPPADTVIQAPVVQAEMDDPWFQEGGASVEVEDKPVLVFGKSGDGLKYCNFTSKGSSTRYVPCSMALRIAK